MKITELLELAEIKAGGHRALAKLIPWNEGTLSQAKKKGKVPAWVAGRLAEICDISERRYYFERIAAAEAALSEPERSYWVRRSKESGFSEIELIAIIGAAIATTCLTLMGFGPYIAEISSQYTLCAIRIAHCLERMANSAKNAAEAVCRTMLGAAAATTIRSCG